MGKNVFSSLNRTSVGLKRALWISSSPPSTRLNRTSVGLKRSSTQLREAPPDGLNRTSVGLKRGPGLTGPRRSGPPQSNQRGIETTHRPLLNQVYIKPQSNQRGIETVHPHFPPKESSGPQSNQRGIETKVRVIIAHPRHGGLNRTSVGLKLFWNRLTIETHLEPQSNQRGIETMEESRRPGRHSRPQSNQRGIETLFASTWPPHGGRASIEPAWD